MKNSFLGKVASNFISLIMRISIFPPKIDESNSNSFLMEFVLRCPIIILLECLTRRFFNPKIISYWLVFIRIPIQKDRFRFWFQVVIKSDILNTTSVTVNFFFVVQKTSEVTNS